MLLTVTPLPYRFVCASIVGLVLYFTSVYVLRMRQFYFWDLLAKVTYTVFYKTFAHALPFRSVTLFEGQLINIIAAVSAAVLVYLISLTPSHIQVKNFTHEILAGLFCDSGYDVYAALLPTDSIFDQFCAGLFSGGVSQILFASPRIILFCSVLQAINYSTMKSLTRHVSVTVDVEAVPESSYQSAIDLMKRCGASSESLALVSSSGSTDQSLLYAAYKDNEVGAVALCSSQRILSVYFAETYNHLAFREEFKRTIARILRK